MTAPDDDSVISDENALRRVPLKFVAWDGNRNTYLPTNASMSDRSRTEFSVYLETRLPYGTGRADVAAGSQDDAVVYMVTAGEARHLRFGVQHRPDQDSGPLRQAHGNITADPMWPKMEFRRRRNDLVRRLCLAWGAHLIPTEAPFIQ